MNLPPTFRFSQNSLQDFIDCERRFQLNHLLHLAWPAVESEPLEEYERLLDIGSRFHQLVRRHNLGLPETELAKGIDDPDLMRWWRNYLESPPADLPSMVRQPELSLSTPLVGYRLMARYDLLAVDPGQRAVIVDWKTGRKRPDPTLLARRLQTRVYRSVLVKAGMDFNGGVPLVPNQVTMVYWFAEHPAEPVTLPYDDCQYAEDVAYLSDLIQEITQRVQDGTEWSLTADQRVCRFCNYRSLCDRGIVPGTITEFDIDQVVDINLDVEFEEVEEIEY